MLGQFLSKLDDIIQRLYPTVGATFEARFITVSGAGLCDGSFWENAASVNNLSQVIDATADASPRKVYVVLLAAGKYVLKQLRRMKNYTAIIGGWKTGGWTRDATEVTILSGGDAIRTVNN